MPLLLEDLAEDAAAGLSRTADRFDAAAKEFARPDATGDEVAQFARHITAYALAELPRAEAIRQWDVDQTRKEPAEVERRWLALQSVFALQARLCTIARRAWKQAESLGVAPEQVDELHKAWVRFEQFAHRMKKAVEHREHGWQPKDPERYAREMRAVAEGKVKPLTVEEALARLRAKSSPPTGE